MVRYYVLENCKENNVKHSSKLIAFKKKGQDC